MKVFKGNIMLYYGPTWSRLVISKFLRGGHGMLKSSKTNILYLGHLNMARHCVV